MDLKPKEFLTEEEVQKGLKVVIWDGLTSEVMTSFTGGAFLVSMALLLGASNVEIGVLAALPMFTNIFQLLSIWLVGKFNNRRAVTVYCAFLARFPLIIVGILVLTSSSTSINVLIFFLFFYYLFGSIAGPSWNSWMKDMVPENMLGDYFSKRSRYTQTLNVVLSLSLALLLDFVKSFYMEYELTVYGVFFIAAGIIGIIGGVILSKAPEPQSYLSNTNIFALFKRPMQNENFKRLLLFNSAWVFALNIATPFFIVFLLKSMRLPISYIIVLATISQIFSILTIRTWGAFSDRYSNKSIISISAPLYILCMIGWCFVGSFPHLYANMALLVVIQMISGMATSGINLSLTNIGLKLSPKKDAIVYLSVKNIITSVFSSIGPLIGGFLADVFADKSLSLGARWISPGVNQVIRVVSIHDWKFLFIIGALLALISLELLIGVKEVGEVNKDVVRRIMRKSIRSNLKDYFLIGDLIHMHQQLKAVVRKKEKDGKQDKT
ncbi:MFS transporter [Pedobacter immunditicola]|uniref:MFS transporter n=1 Tax=Pedobacter immunditicola TaxID=3133440 RepID=UPI00309AD626